MCGRPTRSPGEDRILFQSVARAILSDGRGTLLEQMEGAERLKPAAPELSPVRPYKPERAVPAAPRSDLAFFNGVGGFTQDGREYIITTTQSQVTPAPWVNVLANANFGTVVSESGMAYTWAENAHEFRLTPWGNDPVSDTGGEAYYLRDEETGHFWSPTALPCRGVEPYVSRHGFGYSVFEHCESGIYSEAWVYVATDAPVKFTVLKTPQRFRPRAQTFRHRLRGVGAGRSAAENRHARGDGNGHRQRADLRAQCLQHRVCRPGRFLRLQRAGARVDRQTGGSFWDATARWPPRRR